MTPQDSPEARIAEIREREQKAMRGPWVVAPCPDDSELCDIVSEYSELPNGGKVANWIAELDSGGIDTSDDVAQMHDNATFIAHAREDIPYLLGRLHEQAQEIERLRAQALAISASLAEFRIGPCSLPQGVIELGQRAEAAESALAAAQQAFRELAEHTDTNGDMADRAVHDFVIAELTQGHTSPGRDTA
jgi:hypothetical protein